MAGHVVNSRKPNLKSSSVNNVVCFNSSLKDKKEAFKVDQKVFTVLVYSVF